MKCLIRPIECCLFISLRYSVCVWLLYLPENRPEMVCWTFVMIRDVCV